MIDDRPQLEEALAGYALTALDPAESARVGMRLARAAAARRLDEYQRVIGILPCALPRVAPRPEVRGALLRRIREEGVSAPRGRRGPALALLRWAAVVLLVAGLGAWNLDLRAQLADRGRVDVEALARQPDRSVVTLVGTGCPSASARLFVSEDGRRGQLAVTGLPALPPQRVYQLWFARPSEPVVSAGAFRVNAQGEAMVAVAVPMPVERARAIAVTEEPAPGSPIPTGVHLLDLRT